MNEIRIHGRGGQGGVTLAKILASAHHLEGRSVQAFGIYAAERSGAPLQAFLRYDEQPIHNPNMIYEPDHIIVLDPTLIGPGIFSGLKPGGFVLLNTDRPPEEFAAQPDFAPFRVATVDATGLALANGLGTRAVPILNTALAGATARLTGLGLDSVRQVLDDMGFHGGNAAAAEQAFDSVAIQDSEVQVTEAKKVEAIRVRGPGIVDGNAGAPPAIHTGDWASKQPVWENATPPCNFICPAGNDVQGFLAALTAEDVDEALGILLKSSPLPSVCGRVCPGFCMQQCNRAELDGAVNVRALERYAGDHGKVDLVPAKQRSQHIAVIGSGPAGLSGAYHLACLGYRVTIFEAGSELGGLMRTGIPSYRLPREALDRDIDRILGLGVETVFDTRVDHDGLEVLAQEYDAVLAATGLQKLTSLDLGIEIDRLVQGIEFLDLARRGDIRVTGEDIVVVGGGNTAIDAARSAYRLGANSVRIVYRRTREEMPAIAEEIADALDEGIGLEYLCAPISVASADERCILSCQRMELGAADESGRRRPLPIEGSEFDITCDRVILALGQKADLSLLPQDAQLANGQAVNGETALFAAGDLLTNEGTVTAAIGCGRDMALLLHERFSGEILYAPPPPEASVVRADQIAMRHFNIVHSHHVPVLPVSARRDSFEEVSKGLHGMEEARRCLSCGVCNACDRCVTYCPDGVLRREGECIVFDYDYCKGCGVCVSECPRAVIQMQGA